MVKDISMQDEVSKLAQEQFAKEEAEVEKKLAVEREVKRLRAEKDEKIRMESAAEHSKNHAATVVGVRKFHGDVMRVVGKKYSADSKPFYVDKGV